MIIHSAIHSSLEFTVLVLNVIVMGSSLESRASAKVRTREPWSKGLIGLVVRTLAPGRSPGKRRPWARTALDWNCEGMETMSNHTPTTPATSQTTEELRIVVGVEGSPCAFRALEYAANQAASTGSILQIVTVYDGPLGYGPFTPVILDQEGAKSVVSAAIDKVHKSHPGVVTKGEIVYGGAGPVLSDVSEGASALVVGTRGRGLIVGALLGSVSEYVVHHAHCTTTVVR